MPTLSKSVPSYRKHRAAGQAVVTISGRDYFLGPHNTKGSKLEHDRVIGEWLASGRSPAFGKPAAEITIAKLLLAYLTHARAYYGTDSRGEYANMIHAVRPLKAIIESHIDVKRDEWDRWKLVEAAEKESLDSFIAQLED